MTTGLQLWQRYQMARPCMANDNTDKGISGRACSVSTISNYTHMQRGHASERMHLVDVYLMGERASSP